MIEVRSVCNGDQAEWLRMRSALWPDDSDGEHAKEIAAFLDNKAFGWSDSLLALAVFVAVRPSGGLCGFVEASIRPKPVTNPSPAGRFSSEPKSMQRCRTNLSSSSNVPSSSSRCIRSRAESFPALCSRSRRSAPPPSSASADIRRNWFSRSALIDDSQVTRFLSGKWASLRGV